MIGSDTAARTARLARNHAALKSMRVVASRAANVTATTGCAAVTNAFPIAWYTASTAPAAAAPPAWQTSAAGPMHGSTSCIPTSVDARAETGEERHDRVRPTDQDRASSSDEHPGLAVGGVVVVAGLVPERPDEDRDHQPRDTGQEPSSEQRPDDLAQHGNPGESGGVGMDSGVGEPPGRARACWKPVGWVAGQGAMAQAPPSE